MVVADIKMAQQLSTKINRCSWSSLAMLCITLSLIILLVDLAYSSVTCGTGIKSIGGKKLQYLKMFIN